VEQETNSVGKNLVGELIFKKTHGLVGHGVAEERAGWHNRQR